MSQVSSWLGPPTSISMMQLTSRAGSTRPAAFSTAQIAEAQAEQRQRSRVQEVTPPHAVAEVHALFCVELEHGPSRLPAADNNTPGRAGRRTFLIYDRRMQYRTFGRTGWQVSEIGYGMWGMAGWTGSDDEESRQSLDRAVELGCNFFDTAWAYGDGRSEQLLGELLKRHPGQAALHRDQDPAEEPQVAGAARVSARATSSPPTTSASTPRSACGTSARRAIDLQQFHVWDDSWAADDRWQRAVGALKEEGLVKAIGISINRWQPANVLKALATGLIDSVQVVYNIFDQAPEDELFVECQRRNIAVIARVPFDEGSLTGTLTAGHDVAGRGLPQHLLPAREPEEHARARREAASGRAGRHDDAGTGAAAHPPAPRRQYRHPGHAEAAARRAEPGGERRAAAAGRAHG